MLNIEPTGHPSLGLVYFLFIYFLGYPCFVLSLWLVITSSAFKVVFEHVPESIDVCLFVHAFFLIYRKLSSFMLSLLVGLLIALLNVIFEKVF